MKLSTLCAGLLCAAPALAQTPTSFTPPQNAPAASCNTAVAVTLSAPAGPGAATGLKVFGTQAGGKKSGATTVAGSSISFAPTSPFKPGETVMATLASGAAVPKVWQFTAAATGGSGSFGSSSTLSVPYEVGSLRLADVDGDGDLDLLTVSVNIQTSTTSAVSTGIVKVHLNDGLGAFTTAATFSLAPENMGGVWAFIPALEVADIDADGDLDMLVSSVWARVSVLVNDGAGGFTVGSRIDGGSISSFSIVTGDIDGDGDIDYLATTRGSSSHTFTSATIAGINDGSGNFTVATNRAIAVGGEKITALKDMNGDGTLDAVGTVGSGVCTWLNNGSGSFGSVQWLTEPGDTENSWVLEDFDADGDLDLAVVTTTSCTTCPATIKIRTNDGNGNFSNSGWLALPYPGQLSSADVNGDGRIDLLLTGYSSAPSPNDTISVWRNMGSGAFSRPAAYAITRSRAAIVTGDVDGDGDIDLVASRFATSTLPAGTSTMLNGLGAALATAAPTVTRFGVWPNPATAANALHLTLAVPASRASLRLATVLGQVVRTQAFSGNSATIATAGLASGVYLLTVQADGQAPFTRRVAVE